ncbi:MAG: MFS transporter [Fimbriimonadaceae bacterium]
MSKPITRIETLANLRKANLDLAFASAFVTLVGGSFLVGFIQYVGGSDIWIGLLTAIGSLFGLLQIPGAIWGRRFSTFKTFILPGAALFRLMYVPLVFLPFLPMPGTAKLTILAFCISAAAAAVFVIQPIHNDWMAEMVPSGSRGWFFARRNQIATAFAAGVGILGGLLLDAFKRAGHPDWGYSATFGLAIVCGGVSLAFLLAMRDVPRPNPIREPLWPSIRAMVAPIGDREFRKVLLFLAIFILGQAFAGNLFSAFALGPLELPMTVVQVTIMCHAVGLIATARAWGFLADRYGNRPILMVLGVGLVLTPLMWLFCEPGEFVRNTTILVVGHFFSGAVWGGILTLQFNLLLATAKPEDRANYIGMGTATQALMGGVAPLLGAYLATVLQGQGMVAADAYKHVFVAAMALRLLALGFLIPVREEGAMKIRDTLRQLRNVTPKGYAALRAMSQSPDATQKARAIKSAGRERFSLAAGEVSLALHDPSPKVRRQAALALAQMRDPQAAEALVHQLEEHPDLVEEEMIEALGEMGGVASVDIVEPLIRCLQSPRAIIRRAAARALGRIGDPRAIPHLTLAASDPVDSDLRRGALQALRVLGAREAGPAITQALFDSDPSVRIAAAEAVAELDLREAEPYVRQSLSYFDDEAQSEVAYALGCVGTLADLPTILERAAASVSAISRRRCQLGAARLLGVESPCYPLLVASGFARDQRIVELLGPVVRKNKGVLRALDQYGAGDEEKALRTLAQSVDDPVLETLAATPSDELFLVAACRVARKA